MEALGAVASIGNILSGLKTCYREVQGLRYAWQHGPRDLQDFSFKVKLFAKAFKQVPRLIESDPRHANDIRKLGHHVLYRLDAFLNRFQKFLPELDHSRRARFQTKIGWYLQKKTANSLLATISYSEVSLNLWVTIEIVRSKDKSIRALQEIIQKLELETELVSSLSNDINMLQHENSELKQQCKEKIKEMKAIQKEHKAEMKAQRDRGNAKANIEMDAVYRFLSETIRPLIRENAVVLELDKGRRPNSSRHRSSHSTSDRSHRRNRAASTEDILSRSASRAKNLSTRADYAHTPLKRASSPSVEVNRPVEMCTSREVPRISPRNSTVSLFTSASQDLESHGKIAESELQEILAEHKSAAKHREGPEAVEDDKEYARSERSNICHDGGGTAATEAVEEQEAHLTAADCSSHLDANETVSIETVEESVSAEQIAVTAEEVPHIVSIEVTEGVSKATSFTDTELQEYGRKIEQQSNEHTDNVFRDKRARLCREQEEAEARLFGRPQGREDAREFQPRKLRRDRHPGHNT